MGILEGLSSGVGLTNSEKEAAAYIYRNRQRIRRLTLSHIAKGSYTSNATVVRLCRKLGCAGYRELQIAVAAELMSENAGPAAETSAPPFDWAGTGDTISKALSTQISAALSFCEASISGGAICSAARRIIESRYCFIVGTGDASVIADAFAHALSLCGIHIIPAYRHNEMISASGLATERDTALVVSFSETLSGELDRGIRRLHQAGCHIINISSSTGDIIGDLMIRMGNGDQGCAASSALANRVILDFILSWIAQLIAAEKEWRSSDTAE